MGCTAPHNITFDVIVLQDVLEHVSKPLQMMMACRALANDGARIYCAFPNKDSLVAKLIRERWRMVRSLGHLHYFSLASAAKLFLTSGWTISRIQARSPNEVANYLSAFTPKDFIKELLLGRDQWYVKGQMRKGQ